MIVRARAPLRISFGGGGTDVSPYIEKYGGVVLSTTIDRYAYCTVSNGRIDGYSFESADLELSEFYPDLTSFRYNGKLDLAKVAVKTVCGNGKGNGQNKKLQLQLMSESPPGSGLGSSSALMVAVIKAVSDFLNFPTSCYSIAELAYKLERVDLNIKGGYQDQYASTFGGFNFIEFSDKATVNPLRIRNEILRELLACLVLVDTGKSRLSSNILSRQIDSYEKEDEEVMESLVSIKKITFQMKSALLRGDLITFGELLGQEWGHKKRLDEMISNEQIDQIYEKALTFGAIGGKVLGAGNGGHMLFFVDFGKKKQLLKYLESNGYRTVPFNFDTQGVVSWRLGEEGVIS